MLGAGKRQGQGNDREAEQLFDVRGFGCDRHRRRQRHRPRLRSCHGANGARVSLLDRDQDRLREAFHAMRADGSDVRREIADVTDRTQLTRAFDAAAQSFGRIDVVFANAGVGGGRAFSPSTASAIPTWRSRACRRALAGRPRRQPERGVLDHPGRGCGT